MMSELNQPFNEVMAMPVHAVFELLTGHSKNSEPLGCVLGKRP
jgi:hypothetical protein